jgi:hypothetical protein
MHLRFVVPTVLVGMVGAAVIATITVPADAARRKGRVCQAGHFHYGSSAGQRSKKGARAKAIADWSEFTAFEYGNAWARFKHAGSRRVQCAENAAGWGCSVEAVPCHRR